MRGFLSHIDFSVARPAASIAFYDALLTELGFRRWREAAREWQEPEPERAAWGIAYPDGSSFGIDLRPAVSDTERRYDRYAPGPHHIAFQADTDEVVDSVFRSMRRIGATITDEPADYGGQPGYGDHYYAFFLLDPDGFKVEVVHVQGLNA